MMLEQEIAYAVAEIHRAIVAQGYEVPAKMGHLKPQVREGRWVIASPVAMQVAKAAGADPMTIAEGIATHLRATGHFAEVYVENLFINCALDLSEIAAATVREVLTTGAAYGESAPNPERVMIEYGALNTHKEVHVGHLRNLALGAALVRVMRAAGFTVIPAAYIGDIGLHVIKCLWCYRAFHQGREPADPYTRGAWLGELYTEANRRLEFRKSVTALVERLIRDDVLFRHRTDYLLMQLRDQHLTEDIATLMGMLASGKSFAPDNLRNPATMPALWSLIGQVLRDELRREANRPPETETQTPALAEIWDSYGQLDADFAEWWGPSAMWEADMRALYHAYDAKDRETLALWDETRQWSLDYLRAIYLRLRLPIEVYFFESEEDEPGRLLAQDLLERGIAEVSDGLPVVKIDEKLGLTKETYRVLPVLRSDGTSLYQTKDLALAQKKFANFGIDRSVYVVDAQQGFYMQQVFKVLELMGWPQAAKCHHLSYAFVRLPEGKMSSRSGNVVLFDDLEREALERAHAAVEEKNPELSPETKEAVAMAVGQGALFYGMLDRDNNKEIVFEWERALSFDGHAAPYIQYAHARACRIIERAAAEGVVPSAEFRVPGAAPAMDAQPEGASPAPLTFQPEELNLLQKIGDFPVEVRRAAEEYSPLIIANYVYDLAKLFADFYNTCPVLQAAEPTRTMRLSLVAAMRQTLANGLTLLGIVAPDVM